MFATVAVSICAPSQVVSDEQRTILMDNHLLGAQKFVRVEPVLRCATPNIIEYEALDRWRVASCDTEDNNIATPWGVAFLVNKNGLVPS
eukprot:768913-Amphidinium_carterae.1